MNKLWLLLILLIIAFIFPLLAGDYFIHVITTILIFLALSFSWDLMLRTGQLSFGTSGFFGLGAYASVLVVFYLHTHPLLSILIGGIVAALIAFGLGFIVLNLREIYFAITTLALTHVFKVIIKNMSDLTGGASGTILPNAIFNGNPEKIYWLVLILTLIVIGISEFFKRSKIHFAINSIRNDEVTARSSGIDVFKYLIFVFVLTSAIQGVIGATYAQQYAFVNPESTFSLNFLLLPIAMALVGGIYTTRGPIIGAFVLGLISEYLKLIMPYGHLIVYGVIIILVVLFLPGGIYRFIETRFINTDTGGITNAQSGN